MTFLWYVELLILKLYHSFASFKGMLSFLTFRPKREGNSTDKSVVSLCISQQSIGPCGFHVYVMDLGLLKVEKNSSGLCFVKFLSP